MLTINEHVCYVAITGYQQGIRLRKDSKTEYSKKANHKPKTDILSSSASKYTTLAVATPKRLSTKVRQMPFSPVLVNGPGWEYTGIFTHRHQIAQILPEGEVRELLHALGSYYKALVKEPTNDVDCNYRSKPGGQN